MFYACGLSWKKENHVISLENDSRTNTYISEKITYVQGEVFVNFSLMVSVQRRKIMPPSMVNYSRTNTS